MKRNSFLAKASMMLLAVLFSLTGAKAQNAAPTNVAASEVTASSAKISWEGSADSYNLRYTTAFFFEGFENGLPSGWTIVDADGDGYKWESADGGNDSKGNPTAFGGKCFTSASWISGTGALTPDNWLISPALDLGGTLSVWLRGQDPSWAAEHFSIMLSTATEIADVSDFTIELVPEKSATSVFVEYTADLSAYAGQKGFIAIRHFNCTDMFRLNVDNFCIIPADEGWTTLNNATNPYTFEGLTETTGYMVQVQGVYEGGTSEWASVIFTTTESVPAPTDLAVSEVGPNSAKLSWTENGEATSWVISVYDETEEDSFGEFTTSENPYTLTGLTPNHTYSVYVRPAGDNNKWSEQLFFETFYPVPTDLTLGNITTTSAEISWAVDADATGAVLEYADATGAPLILTEYKYDNGTYATGIGLGGGAFSWGVMFPAGSYTGNALSKVSVYDAVAMTGSVTIYNDGDTAPEYAVASAPVTLTGSGDFINIEINTIIDASKNVWVIFNNESGAGYPAACSVDELDDANGRWVEISGTWYDLASAGVPGYSFMVRAAFGTPDFSDLSVTTVEDATSPYELTGLTPETTYAVRVKSIFKEGESKWTSAIFTTASDNPVPANIVADLAADGATLTWEGKGDSYNVQYRTPAAENPLFEADFSNGWTIYTEGDAAGAWTLNSGSMTAHSWTNSDGALNADNWLISPAVELNGTLKFTVGVEDAYADSYEVLLSTTGIDIADFTTELQTMAPGTNGQRVSIDLSAYAGETGYIAIHHVDNDNNYLSISNLGIYEAVPAGAWESMAVTGTTATISGLATNKLYEYQIQSVKDGNTSEWSEAGEFALLTLDSDADNTSLISTFDGKLAHVTLANRTLYKNGTWNTICLPFTLTDLKDTPLEGADVRTLSGVNVSDYTITLNFTNEGAIETAWGKYYGGVPYLLKWDDDTDIVNPEFANVIIESDLNNMSSGNAIGVTFKGTYAPLSFEEEDKSILFVGAENKLYWPLAGAKIGAMRGYFEIDGTEAEIAEASAKQFILNFGDEDATSIETISTSVESESIYNLAGQKMSKMQKGINIVNGKKILK